MLKIPTKDARLQTLYYFFPHPTQHQIAMMTSVYCTIVMSFERYVRIGGPISCVRSCGGYITEKNFK